MYNNKYEKIIYVLCDYKGICTEDVTGIIKDDYYKSILFLLLKKYKCIDLDRLKKDFGLDSKRRVMYNYKKAKERFLVNREFRELYFEIEEIINKIIIG